MRTVYEQPTLFVERFDENDAIRTSLLGDGDYGAEWKEEWGTAGGTEQ